jgi:3-oxoacyl-[acyl-carrier protein] reductase
MTDLKDKTIFISGASRGVGFKLAEQLNTLGVNLILHASQTESIERLKKVFGTERHQYFLADFYNPETLEEAWKNQISPDIRLDGFVNCVGVRSRRPLNLLKVAHVSEVLNANLISFLEMVRILTKKNTYNKGFSIVTISSISAHSGGSGVTAYAASKAGTEAAVRCLAKELHKKDVRINSLVCGQIKTESYDELMDSKSDSEDKVLDRQFMGLGSTENISNILLFLLSNQSSFITGSSIPADGGYLN